MFYTDAKASYYKAGVPRDQQTFFSKIGGQTCPKCGSHLLVTFRHPSQYAKECIQKRLQNFLLDEREQKVLTQVRRMADIVLSYGKKGIIALQVHGIGPQTAARILAKMHYDDEAFYKDLLEAKITYLRTRQYWDN